MGDRQGLIQQVVAFTGCNEYQAGIVLERSIWDVERAVNAFFDNPPPEKPSNVPNTQSASTAVVPFQGSNDNQPNTSGWETASHQPYGPPIGPPPAGSQGWEQNNKDLTNETDADEDLRRAMEASLQDQQSQQRYRPPAPSSTVGVSDMSATKDWSITGQKYGHTHPSSDDDPLDNGDIDEGAPGDQSEDEFVPVVNSSQSNGGSPPRSCGQRRYQLRDRSTIVKPNRALPTLVESTRPTKQQKTFGCYGRKACGTNNNIRRLGWAGRRGRGAATRRRGRTGWSMDLGMSEDEQLRQALEASVQSHHDLLQSTGSGARTPALPQHLETDLQTRRVPGSPIAMVAPFASLEVVAAILQALYAAPPVRRAYLAVRPIDPRGADLSNYWKGSSPTDGITDVASKPSIEPQFELAQRIQTLFAFAQLSQRPLCVVRDITALTPSEVIARGADHTPAAKVASLFHEFLVDSFTKHHAAVNEIILNTPGAGPVESDALWMNDGLFLSSGAPALTSPAAPPTESADASLNSPPKLEQQRSYIQLRHDSVNSDIYSCLRAALASDGEGALLTRTGRTISMGIDHALPTLDGGPPPLTIKERIYLDSLMWDRRQGVRLDAELRDMEMVRLDALRQELEARKVKLMGDGGRPSIEVLQGAKRYFEQVAAPSEASDPVRSATLAEAALQISKIQAAVRADLAATDGLIAKVRAQIDAKRALVAERAKREAANPEWTQLAYNLVAVLCQEAGRVVSLVKQPSGEWWKISNGRAKRIETADVVMGRPQDPSLSVFWVVYARAESSGMSVEEEAVVEEELISEAVKAAIADDNLTYESELLSLIRSDAATPSSTATDVNVADERVDETADAAGKNAEEDVTMTMTVDADGQDDAGSIPTANVTG